MARGLPAVWSSILGLPFIISGLYAVSRETYVPDEAGLPFVGFGVFVVLLGLYIHYVAAPDPPTMREGENIIETRNPAQRAAAIKTAIGFVLMFVTGYLLFFTFEPYIYPIVTLVGGLYLFSTGLFAYWTNTLTTYYVTNRRLIKEYRFISLVREEIPFDKVRGVEERRSIWETIVGLGNVRVASGGGGALEVVVRNIYSPTAFADEVRNLL
ncbi:MAG: PH domain-containing protein [Natronomonas sp.]